jgi:hypothetical protein
LDNDDESQAQGAWPLGRSLDKGGVDPQEDMMSLDALVSSVPLEMVVMVANKGLVKEAWDAIATMCIGDDRVKKAVAQ